MAKKRKTKKPTVKRGKRSIRAVDVFTPDVSDEALERAAAGNPFTDPFTNPQTRAQSCDSSQPTGETTVIHADAKA
jgi:hypothetical protein